MSGVEIKVVDQSDVDIRLDKWFARHYPALKHGQLSKLLRKGQIRINGGRVKAGARVSLGDQIRVPPMKLSPQETRSKPGTRAVLSAEDSAAIKAMVLYEDDDIIALNKPAGLPVQGGTKMVRHLDGMLDGLRAKGGERPRLVHRLDKDTSGILLVARTAASAKKLAAAFKGRQTKKIYWALVCGNPQHRRGEINLKMEKLPGKAGERMVESESGKPSQTYYQTISKAGNRTTWLALRPITGRTHQLRLHMAIMQTPIVGDGKYGGKDAYLTGSISKKLHLHARSISVAIDGGRTLDIWAPLPPHMAATWSTLGFEEGDAANIFEDE
jgi:23S rRNA pseudouridine955/2504/2580 synthase